MSAVKVFNHCAHGFSIVNWAPSFPFKRGRTVFFFSSKRAACSFPKGLQSLSSASCRSFNSSIRKHIRIGRGSKTSFNQSWHEAPNRFNIIDKFLTRHFFLKRENVALFFREGILEKRSIKRQDMRRGIGGLLPRDGNSRTFFYQVEPERSISELFHRR